MKRFAIVLIVVLLSLGIAMAQTEAGVKSTTTATGNTSASAAKSDVQAQSNTSASTSQEAGVNQKPAKDEPSKREAKASASGSADASASAKAGESSATLAGGTTIQAALTKSVSAKKNKEGDQVEGKTTEEVKSDGKVVIPRGSKLIGHVTKAKARAKGESESELGIVFDRVLLKDGREMPLNATIQAVAASQSAVSSTLAADQPMAMGPGSTMTTVRTSGQAPSGGGGLLGGTTAAVGSTVGATVNTVGNATGGVVDTAAQTTGTVGGTVAGTTSASAELISTTTGVVGLEGLGLNSDASNQTQGSVIASSTRNVDLQSGTRLLLRTASQ